MGKDYVVKYENGKNKKIIPHVHYDDTIDIFKKKVILAFNSDIAYDEIYLFIKQSKTFIPEQLFRELSQNGRIDVTPNILLNFLVNFDDPSIIDKLKSKDIYTIEDIHDLRLDKPHILNIPVGQRFLGYKSTSYPYVVDPFSVTSMETTDLFLLEHSKSMISTQNAMLLLQLGEIIQNTFYLITASEVFEHINKMKIPNTISGIYMPFLFKKDITTVQKLTEQKQTLLETNRKNLSPTTLKTIDSVNIFNDIYETDASPIIESGIKDIHFTLYQPETILIPLEELFKIFHSTKEYPFVKLNPGFRRENLLRLYCEDQTINGKKIPYLSKAMIIKLIKYGGKKASIIFSIDNHFMCSIYEDGSIKVFGDLDTLSSVEDIEERIRILINPMINIIKTYVQQSGFNYELFTTLYSKNIEILSITYLTKLPITKKINVKKNIGCVSSVFNIIQDNISKDGGIIMRYKRVSNYSDMDAKDAFIRELVNQDNQREEVIDKLRENFSLSQEEALSIFIAFITQVDLEQGVFQNRKLRIKENPGFPCTVEKEPYTNNVIFTISDINLIMYLAVLPIYVSSFVEIIQGKHVDKTKLICKGSVIVEDKTVNEIITRGEKSFLNQEIPAAQEFILDDDDDDDDDGLLDMLMDDDDYDDDDDEDEDEGEEGAAVDLFGGAKGEVGEKGENEDIINDLSGMSLSNPNYFMKRMEDRDPVLFLKRKTGKFNAYSKMCPSNIRRQPVILTEEEKTRIDKTHPGSYSHAIKYGSDPKKPYYYICPRYWCIPENTSLTAEEVEKGVCGGKDAIIPFGAKKIPVGKSIYEFGVDSSKTSIHAYKEFYDDDNKYITHHPGFMQVEKHPDGNCIPCCFKRWDTKEQINRRQICSQDERKDTDVSTIKRVVGDNQKEYIKGEEKFPLEPDRWGYLPIEIQLFFNEIGKDNQVSALNPLLKPTAETLLRYGIETHNTQSFIGCIADIFSDYSNEDTKSRIDSDIDELNEKIKKIRSDKQKTTKIKKEEEHQLVEEIKKINIRPTIINMKQKIIDVLTIDNYTNYQNGNLVTEFYPDKKIQDVSSVSIDDYHASELYKKIDTTDEESVAYFERIIRSYENFIDFLKNNEVVIDYQYLWDIICIPNKKLFPTGLNLIIFEIPEDDSTGNVELICPTNHYSSNNYSGDKQKLIVIKKNNFFEPIYLYNNLTKQVKRLFREADITRYGKSDIANALKHVRDYLGKKCKPLHSMPKIYMFEQNETLDIILTTLHRSKYMKQILSISINYNGKAIGVHIKTVDNVNGYIPCYPSNYEVTDDIKIEFLDESAYWTDYDTTFNFLKTMHAKTKLPCLPVCKVVEDGMVVGIMTKTNQMVPLKAPELSVDDGLNICNIGTDVNEKYVSEIDKVVQTDTSYDERRVSFIQNLHNEKKHYTSFRNIARIELNLYKNNSIKRKLLDYIELYDTDSSESYNKTINDIKTQFKKLMKTVVAFNKIPDYDKFIYPDKNLMTGKNNEDGYYTKLSDEALRYERIKLYLFEKNKYLSFMDIQYNLNENEILIPESMINNEYFEGMVAYKRNKYVHFNTYDTAHPLITNVYSEKMTIDRCIVTPTPIDSKFLLSIYSSKHSVINFGKAKRKERTTICSFDIIIAILANESIVVTKRDIQQLLLTEYNKYDIDNIIAVLSIESKKTMFRPVNGGYRTLDFVMLSEEYYLTFIDLWLIATHYKLPIIFFGQYKMSVNGKKTFATKYKADKNEYYQINTYAAEPNIIPRYKLILSPSKQMKFDIKPYISKRFYTAFPINKKNPTINEYIKGITQ